MNNAKSYSRLAFKKRLIAAVSSSIILFAAGESMAANLFFDVNGTNTGSGVVAAGSYSWEGSFWATTSAGTLTTAVWTEGNFPEFSAGSDATGSYTINAGSPHHIVGVLQRTSTATVTLTGADLTIDGGVQQGFFSSGFLNISNKLTGTGGVICSSGQLLLNGTNDYSGGTTPTALLNFNNTGSFGTGPLLISSTGGALICEGSAAITITNAWTVSLAAVTLNCVGNTAGITYSGNVSLGANTLNLGSGGAAANVDIFSGVISGTGNLGRSASQSPAGIIKFTGANTYTGKTSIQSGSNFVSSINSVTTPAQQTTSSMGKPSSVANGTISFGSTSVTGSLVYTGAGEFTDRVIDLAGTTGGGIIENDGTGPIVFTSANTATGAGAKTLTLQGSNTGTNTIKGAIVNSTGLTSVTKAGTGQWILSGVNTYSGNTTISGTGVLGIGGASAIGASNSFIIGGTTPFDNVSGSDLVFTQAFTMSGGSPTYVGSANNVTFNGAAGITTANRTITVSGHTLTLGSGVTSSGAFGLTKAGAGTLVLNGINTYTNNTAISAGTLALGSSGSLANSTNITISAGATFDVSAIPVFAFSTTNGLTASGNANPATIIGGGTVDFGSQKITLTSNNGTDPSLVITSADLNLNGNPIVVTGTVLAGGSHVLIHLTSGNINIAAAPTVSGTALGASVGTLSVVGSDLVLTIPLTPVFTGLTASQSITYGAPSIVLGGTVGATNGTFPAMGETVTVSINGNAQSTTISDTNGDFSIVYDPSTIPASVAAYPISYYFAGDSLFNAGTNSLTTLTVNKALLTVTPNNQTKTYGTAIAVGAGNTNFTVTGLVNGDMVGSVTLASSGAATNATVAGSPYPINASAATGGTFSTANYALTYGSGSLTVTAAPLTITPGNQTKVYGTTLTLGAGSTNFTATGLQNGETIDSVTLSSSGAVASVGVSGSPYALTANSATGTNFDASNYGISYIAGQLAVTPAPLTVTADNVTQPYGATNPVYTVTYSNFVNSETIGTSDVTGVPAFTNMVATNTDVGVYTNTLLAGTLGSTNYSFVLVDGTITVTNAVSTNSIVTSLTPALPGSPVTFTTTIATLAPSLAVPTNTVQFVIDGIPNGAPVSLTNGIASFTTSSLTHGTHTIESDYAGDTNALGTNNILGSTNTFAELINTAPVAGTATYGRTNDTVLTISVSNLLTFATDADGDTLSLVSITSPSTNGATVTLSGGTITYTQAGTNGNVPDQFSYTVTDTFGATNTGLVVITNIAPFTGPPVNITGITTATDGSAQISFAGYPNQHYLIQSTTNLTAPVTWLTLTNIQADTNGLFQYNDLSSTNYQALFYRTKLP